MNYLKLLLLIIALNLYPLFAFSGIEVMGKFLYMYNARKGETYLSVIKVYNNSSKDQEVKIYLKDYLFNYQGNSYYNEPPSHKRSNALWISYNPKTLILKGNETQNIQFEVSVPQSDTLIGTYWSLLMVEGVTPPNPNSNSKGLTIHETFRYAIQIATNIEKTGIGQLEFQQTQVVNDGEKLHLDFILLNTGERYISPAVSMELFDAKTGLSIKVMKLSNKGLYPATSNIWSFPLEGVPKGKTYKALILADGSGDDVFGLEYTIVL